MSAADTTLGIGPTAMSGTRVRPTATVGRAQDKVSRQRHDWPLVLVVDGDESYRQVLASVLRQEGFEVECAANGGDGFRLLHRVQPDLILLDAILPDQSGMDLCQRMQATGPTPVIIVTARDSEVDTVFGLELGASDYVSKPFRVRELVARMRAVLRRVTTEAGNDVLALGPVRLALWCREVQVRGRTIELSRKEFDLLHLLMSHAEEVVTRESCIDRLWHDRPLMDTRTLDTHVKRLRSKIEPDRARPRHIVTVRGVGFRFES